MGDRLQIPGSPVGGCLQGFRCRLPQLYPQEKEVRCRRACASGKTRGGVRETAVPRQQLRQPVREALQPLAVEEDLFLLGIDGHAEDVHFDEILEEMDPKERSGMRLPSLWKRDGPAAPSNRA